MKTLSAIILSLLAMPALAAGEPVLQFAPEQVAAFGIETAPVRPAERSLSKNFPAKVAVPNAQLRVLGAPLDGVVESLLVAEGESVTAGQPLARIRSSQLLDQQAAYLASRTRRLLAAETVARERQLRAEGIVAERRLRESESSLRELRSAEERDRQALRLAGMPEDAIDELARGQQLSAVLDVKAPLSGVVLEQMATAGQRLAAADPLYRIGDLSTLWVEVHVPLERLGKVAPGSLVDLPEQGLKAHVITVGRMVHGTDQGVLVRAEVADGAAQLRPGQFVSARLEQEAGGDTLLVPAAALVRSADRDVLFVRQKTGFAAVPATVITREGEEAVVRAALDADAEVVIRGTAALKAALAGGAE